MSATIELDLLGPVRLRREGVPLGGRAAHRKNLALLAYLARTPTRSASRDQLLGVLWPEKGEQAARQSLRQSLSDLRAGLGEEVLLATGAGIDLGEGVAVDLDRWTAAEAAGELAEAARLVRGSFMAGFSVPGENAFDDWLEAERRHVDARTTAALVALAERHLDGGALAEAEETLHLALDLSPRSARVVEVTMKLHALMGDVARALDLHRGWSGRLSEDGIDPDAALERLAERLRHGRRWTRRIPAAAATARVDWPARGAELRRAMECWATVRRTSHAALLVIEGDLGSGRTRLAEAVADRARLDGATALECRFVPQDGTHPEAVVRCLAQALPGTPGLAGGDPADLAALAAYEPRLATVPAESAGIDRGEALTRLLRLAADEAPLVIQCDDLGCVGTAATPVLRRLVRDLARLPVLFVVTDGEASSDPTLQQLRADLAGVVPGAVLRLAPLGVAELEALIAHEVPERPRSAVERLARRIHVDTRGNLLLATAMLTGTIEGAAPGEGEAWPHPERTLDETRPGELPAPALGAIRSSYWQVPEATREVLLAAAAMEERFTAQQLHGAVGREPTEALDWLEWHRWIAAAGGGYLFRTRLVREILRTDMLTDGQRHRFRRSAGLDDGPEGGEPPGPTP